MIRRNLGLVVVAAVLVVLFALALDIAQAQGKLSLLALDLTEHLFGIVLAVFGDAKAGRDRYRFQVGEGGVEGVRWRVRFRPGDLVRHPSRVQNILPLASRSSSPKTARGQ